MARALGIDLGAHAVKVAVFEGSLGRYALKRVVDRLVPKAEGLPSLETRLGVLRALLVQEGIDGSGAVAVAWPGERLSMRVVDLPFSDRAKIERTLPFEMENHVPFEMDHMILEHRLVSRTSSGARVLTCLVDREAVASLLQGMKERGVDPRHVVPDSDLLAALAEPRGVQAVVDVGWSRTVVSLVVDGIACHGRAIEVGGRDLVRRVQRIWNVEEGSDDAWIGAARVVLPEGDTPEVAVDRQPDEPVTPTAVPRDAGETRRALDLMTRDWLTSLVSELRASLLVFEDRLQVEVGEVLTTGGVSGISGLNEALAQELGVPVRPVALPGPALLLDAPQRYGLCVAAGMRAADLQRGRPLELRRGAFARGGTVEILGAFATYGLAAAGFFVVAGGVVWAVQHQRLAGRLDDVEEQIAGVVASTFPDVDPDKLDDSSMAVAIMQERALATTTRVEALQAAVLGEPPTLTLLKDLSAAMPPPEEARIDVKELTISENAMSIKAETDGYDTAARIETSLKQSARFKDATKGDEKKMGDHLVFTVTVPLGDDDEEEETSPTRKGG
jgi:Tfp pilus assembly PilM family ATPase